MKDLKRAFGSPDPDFQDRVRQTLFQIEEKEETVVKKKMTFSMALALILCVCIITVSAFAGSTLLTEKPDVTQPPLSHSESSSPNGTGEPVRPIPTPQPTITPIPGVTPVPDALNDPAASLRAFSTYVYLDSSDASLYHLLPDCGGVEHPVQFTLLSAVNMGLTACSDCLGDNGFFYTSEDDPYFHPSRFCCEGKRPEEEQRVTLIEAYALEKVHCPGFASAYEITGDSVWSAAGDTFYHASSNCSALTAEPAELPLETAENLLQSACPLCYLAEAVQNTPAPLMTVERAEEFVWSAAGDVCYHANLFCTAASGNTARLRLTDALNRQQTACPLCFVTITPMPTEMPYENTAALTSAPDLQLNADVLWIVSNRDVFWPDNSNIYHASSDCISMSYPCTIIPIYEAVEADAQACPICFAEDYSVDYEVMVTPMPLQTITPMPTVTPAPAAQSIPGAVYLSRSGDGYFHLTPLCDEADSASSLSLTDALNKGFIPCPVCCGNEAVYTINGGDAYHHPDKTCFFYLASSSTSLDVSLTEALLRGKLPCEECVLNRAETEETRYYYTEEDWFCHSDTACLNEGDFIALLASEKELIAMGKRACEACMEPFSYYYTAEGAYYHAVSDCAHADLLLNEKLPEDQLIALGKRNCPWCLGWYDYYYSAKDPCYHKTSGCEEFIGPDASIRPLDEVSLLEMGKIPCEACFEESAPALSENQVYSTPNGVYYHFSPYCTGMKNAESITIAAALERNQKPCPACRTYRTCWIGEDSNLFHMSETCSRLSSAQIQLFSALPDEYQPCGLCVRFLDLNSNQYHRFARCTEFGGEDKANAYILCSTDLPALLGSTPCELCASSSASAPTATPDPAPANAPDFTERDLLISEAFSDTTVFAWDSDAPVYHAVYNCSGYEYLHQMDLTDAAAKNLTPCPECMNTEDTVWYAQDGEYYHSYLHYAYLDLPDVIECAPIDALAAGKRPCGNCMLTETAKADATLGSVPPLWSTGNGEIYFYDYTDGHSMYFHTASSCEAHPMRAPVAISLETAARFELHPCPECSNLLEQVILAEPDDRFYHISDECGAFAVPEYLTRWDAKKLGLEPCPDCAYTDIDRGSPIPTVPPQPVMPPSDDQQALKQWLLNEGEQRYCLTDLGYYSD